MSLSHRGLAVTILFTLSMGAGLHAQPRDEALPPPPPPPLVGSEVPQPEIVLQPPDDGFVPISDLPPEEQLPAAPLLIAAYAFVVVALFAYLLTIARRLGAVKQEIVRLDAELERSKRP
jgi:CcmD family protein